MKLMALTFFGVALEFEKHCLLTLVGLHGHPHRALQTTPYRVKFLYVVHARRDLLFMPGNSEFGMLQARLSFQARFRWLRFIFFKGCTGHTTRLPASIVASQWRTG